MSESANLSITNYENNENTQNHKNTFRKWDFWRTSWKILIACSLSPAHLSYCCNACQSLLTRAVCNKNSGRFTLEIEETGPWFQMIKVGFFILVKWNFRWLVLSVVARSLTNVKIRFVSSTVWKWWRFHKSVSTTRNTVKPAHTTELKTKNK